MFGDGDAQLRRVAWCTGGAQGYFEDAIAAGADVFVSGEVSEQTMHIAAESGITYVAAGHHATERYGVQALGAHLSEQFDIEQFSSISIIRFKYRLRRDRDYPALAVALKHCFTQCSENVGKTLKHQGLREIFPSWPL